MDKHTQTLRWTQMLQAKKKLEDHQFQVDLFPTQKECLEYLKGLLKDQVSVSVGGSMTSVSYTHLDVYKRQELYRPKLLTEPEYFFKKQKLRPMLR